MSPKAAAADPKPAAQVEAEGDTTITLEWEGLSFELPATADDWDADALEALEQGRAIGGLRKVLGTKRFDELAAQFKAKHGRKWKVRDINSFAAVVAEHYGFDSVGD